MKKNLGYLIVVIGILMIVGGFVFTPAHSLNAVDSDNGIDSAATLVYSGFITFGIGLVIYVSTLKYPGEKVQEAN